jgi:Ca-activated chloride channel homolog
VRIFPPAFLIAIFFFGIPDPAPLHAQEQPPLFTSRVDVVDVVVTARKGPYYVDNLEKEDFEIFEEGRKQEIQFFSLETGEQAQPLNIVLLLDTSGSVRDKLRFEQEAAEIFFQKTLRLNADLGAVIQFDSEINLIQDFTNSIGRLENALRHIRPGGATKLYDAVWLAVNDLLSEEVGRRVLVILSDGGDNDSIVKDKEAIKAAQDHDVVIFGIGVRSSQGRSDFGKLKEFARDTGGLFYDSKASLNTLNSAFEEIRKAIMTQYSIGYIPSEQGRNGEFREIEVKVRGDKGRGLKLSHRKGYYSSQKEP